MAEPDLPAGELGLAEDDSSACKLSVGEADRAAREHRAVEAASVVSRAELLRRFAALPGTFPLTRRYAAELTAGTGHDRFDFIIGLMIDGLADR